MGAKLRRPPPKIGRAAQTPSVTPPKRRSPTLAWHEWLAAAAAAIACAMFAWDTPGFRVLAALGASACLTLGSLALRVRDLAMERPDRNGRIALETLAGLMFIMAAAVAYGLLKILLRV